MLSSCIHSRDLQLQTVEEQPQLRDPKKQMAEQSFLAWYFRYAGWRLPSMYNTNFMIWWYHTGRLTAGGEKPLVLHFSDRKLHNVTAADPEWPYLCYRPQLGEQQRRHQRSA